MSRGVSAERERVFVELKEEFKHKGRYRGREEEVAARIVNKQRTQFGETQAAQEKDRKSQSPDRYLPLKNYDGLTVAEILNRLGPLSAENRHRIYTYEVKHRNRKTLIEALER